MAAGIEQKGHCAKLTPGRNTNRKAKKPYMAHRWTILAFVLYLYIIIIMAKANQMEFSYETSINLIIVE